jgi:RNA polymerase sigma-70 factor (ECF subfamily)
MLAQLPQPEAPPDRKVVPLSTGDPALVRGLIAGEQWAANALYDRYAAPIERMLRRTLGVERHTELEDLVSEVFLQAITGAESLRDSVALLGWLQTIAVRTAIRQVRRRKARNWLRFRPSEEVPEVLSEDAPPEIRQACAALYRVLGHLPARERIVFALRFVEGMTIEEVASVCDVSPSTAKRRLKKAEERFAKLAEGERALEPWLRRREGW